LVEPTELIAKIPLSIKQREAVVFRAKE